MNPTSPLAEDLDHILPTPGTCGKSFGIREFSSPAARAFSAAGSSKALPGRMIN